MRRDFHVEKTIYKKWDFPRSFTNYVLWKGHLSSLERLKVNIEDEDFDIIFNQIVSRLYALFYIKQFSEINSVIPSQKYAVTDTALTYYRILDVYRNLRKDIMDDPFCFEIKDYPEGDFYKLTLWEVCIAITHFLTKGTLKTFVQKEVKMDNVFTTLILCDMYDRFYSLYKLAIDGNNKELNNFICYCYKESKRDAEFSFKACEEVCPDFKDFLLVKT